VRGFEVIGSDERRVGRVADVKDGYLIVETGRLRKSRLPVPREFVHAVDEAATVFVTVPRRVLDDAPRTDRSGEFDLEETARHYGLAASYRQTEGAAAAEERFAGTMPGDEAARPALLGDGRIEEDRVRD
jgi:hypothetical protein